MSLPRGRAPNYRLKVNFGELFQGDFVRPVRYYHLPEHVKKQIYPGFDHSSYVYCFTSKGFVAIPWEILEET